MSEDYALSDFAADLELEDFRKEARGLVEANFPKSLAGKGNQLSMAERQ